MNRRRFLSLAASASMVCAAWTGPQAATQNAPRGSHAASPAPDYRAVLDRYCVTCHNERLKTAGLTLDTMDLATVADRADLWEKIVRKLQSEAMPPAGMPRPDQPTRDALVSWLAARLDQAAAVRPDPGRALIHRLNRTEYANAIRDVLALDIDASSLLPPDDSSYGFDNNADVLGSSPVLLERYLTAAGKISALAIGDPHIVPADETYRARLDLTQTRHIEGLPLGTRGGLLIRHTFPLDGEYVIKIGLWRNSATATIRGLYHLHHVNVTLDGARIFQTGIGGQNDYTSLVANADKTAAELDARLQVRVTVKAGTRSVGVAFLQKTSAQPPEVMQPFQSTSDPVDSNGVPQIDTVVISGPFQVTGPGDTPSRRRVFVCRPANAAEEPSCARRILSTVARRAYRRPVSGADVQPLMDFYETGRRKGTFDGGIELALRAILASPDFVFRVEEDPAATPAGTVYRVSDLDLASRLSFFLWSSVPDDQLVGLARSGRLRDPASLAQQVRRMLADERAQALVRNFAAQWLYVRNLKRFVPDSQEFPDFDDNLRQAFQRETELFFESIMREDRNVVDLLTADYTFANERLAKHYGIPHVYGSHFRRVTLTDDARRGLLGKGSILAVTSYPNRTSPVLRGKWILENLLGAPPPPPPPNVPLLKENNERDRPLTMREQMEEHRANPACAGCHKIMDPLGFALENFDAVGAWRVRDAGATVDASSVLADGTRVDGVAALRQTLVRHPQMFVQTMTEKLMTYALGRGLASSDMPAIRSIIRESSRHDYRFSSLILGIVNSVPFQMRKARELQD